MSFQLNIIRDGKPICSKWVTIGNMYRVAQECLPKTYYNKFRNFMRKADLPLQQATLVEVHVHSKDRRISTIYVEGKFAYFTVDRLCELKKLAPWFRGAYEKGEWWFAWKFPKKKR